MGIAENTWVKKSMHSPRYALQIFTFSTENVALIDKFTSSPDGSDPKGLLVLLPYIICSLYNK